MPKILSFGSLNLDYVYSLDHFVSPGETTKSHKRDIFCGGKGLNQSIALKKAGADVYHAGCVGRNSEILLNTLKNENINIDYIETVDTDNGHAIIQLDKNGENCIILFEGSNGCISEKQVYDTFEHFSEGDFLVLQNEINNLPLIMTIAHKKNMQIVLNPSPINSSLLNLPLEYVNYFILNDIEAKDILKTDCEDNLINSFANRYPNAHIILTLGSKGVEYKYKDTVLSHGIYKTEVVDTTAAGDTFCGYFITQCSNGASIEDSLKLASKAASITISKKGAANSIPYLKDLLTD